MKLEDCLPADLRGPGTRLERIAAGLSGAGVYRVEANGRSFVLKVAEGPEPEEVWQQRVALQQLASDGGVAPRVIHVDRERRAVVTEFVVDRGLPAFFASNQSEPPSVVLGKLLRKVHSIPLPEGIRTRPTLEILEQISNQSLAGFALPEFAREAIRRMQNETPPPSRARVLSHNDVNPTNVIYDGEKLMLLDWDAAGPNDPFFDLAAISIFLRMDAQECSRLLSTHDGVPVSALPDAFAYNRRLVATLVGTMFMRLARHGGHGGANGTETLATAPSLEQVYERMQRGSLSPATAEGQWSFGLAMFKESASL